MSNLELIAWSREAAAAPERWANALASVRPKAVLKDEPEDFVVREIPDEAFTGSGEHLLVLFEKTMLSTTDLLAHIQETCGIPADLLGYAGKKDKRAITSQWFSMPIRFEAKLSSFAHPNARILESTRHRNKQRIGHLWGNQFSITVRGEFSTSAQSSVNARWAAILASGVPNFYGPQRFGERSDNAETGLSILLHGPKRGRLPRHQQFLVSATQSAVFNHALSDRLAADQYLKPTAGDLCMPSHRPLPAWQSAIDSRPSLFQGESVPTGIMFGGRAELREGMQFEIERKRLEEVGLTRELVRAWGRELPGSRRQLKVWPQLASLQWGESGETFTINFALPSGSYATVLLSLLFDLGESLSREP